MGIIHHGDVREIGPTLARGSINCIVTSPAYWGLRDYGVADQLGQEPTPDEYVATLVAVFRTLREALRDDGTLWLVIGDSYASHPTSSTKTVTGNYQERAGGGSTRPNKVTGDSKPKDLIGIPWLVAFALRADGWYLRQDIIWHKPNPMPESVSDRPTTAHEHVFLLSKSSRYYYDADAVREPHAREWWRESRGAEYMTKQDGRRDGGKPKGPGSPDGRNARSVWTIPTRPYAGAHFACFAPELARRCILAGCPPGGVVLDPFGGSGTVAAVAIENGRDYELIELNGEYIKLIDKRIAAAQPPLFAASADGWETMA